MTPSLRPYLAGSLAAHAAALAAGFALLGSASLKAPASYSIDFVGPTGGIIASPGPAAGPAARETPALKRAPIARAAAIRRVARHRRFVLPPPSLLGRRGTRPAQDEDSGPAGSDSLAGPAPESAAPSSPPTAASESASAGPGSGGAGVATDLPNFPYPWYISQVRLLLWQAWRARMPAAPEEGTASFLILRNGSITDLSMESSSGDPDFDHRALESVQAAAPFPALPAGFREPFLKIHLTLKSGEA